jgi:hypothetical protein
MTQERQQLRLPKPDHRIPHSMSKIIVEVFDENGGYNVAEAIFNPSALDRYYVRHEGFFCWEMRWTHPNELSIGLATSKGLFNFIKYHIAPIVD